MKKIISICVISLLVLAMVGCSSTDEYYTENGNVYKKPVEEVVEPKEERINEDKLSSLPPLQRLFFELDKDDNWYDIEEKMNKYPELQAVHRSDHMIDSKHTPHNWLEIGYKEDVKTRDVDIDVGLTDPKESYIDGECISVDFLRDSNGHASIVNLVYHKDNLSINYENNIFTIHEVPSTEFKKCSKVEAIEYLYKEG